MGENQKKWYFTALCACMIFLSAVAITQGSLQNDVIRSFQLTHAYEGLSNSLATAGSMIALIVMFAMGGRLSKIMIMTIAECLGAISLICMFLSSSFFAFALSWFFMGMCTGSIDMLMSACVADLYRGKRGEDMMCIMHGVYGGACVMIPVGFAMILQSSLPWKITYAFIAVYDLLVIIYTAILMKMIPKGVDELKDKEVFTFSDLGEVIKEKGFILFGMTACMNGIFSAGVGTWLNRYVGVDLQSNLGDYAIAFLYAGYTITRFAFPFVKIDSGTYLRWCGIAGSLALFAGIISQNGMIMCLAALVTGIVYGAMYPCLITRSCNEFGKSSMLITVMLSICVYIGATFTNPIIGILESNIGLTSGMVLIACSLTAVSVFNMANRRLKSDGVR